jgi:hypothetical protein
MTKKRSKVKDAEPARLPDRSGKPPVVMEEDEEED